MLNLRKRGQGGVYYVRGVIKLGKKKRYVKEHSTGETEERAARRYADKLEANEKAKLTLGIKAKAADVPRPFDIALSDFIDNHKPKAGELWRLRIMLDHFGSTPLQDIDAPAWGKFTRARLPGRKPNTIARYQTTLRTLYRLSGDGVKFPEDVAYIKDNVELVRWLPLKTADKLIDSYAAHARPIALFLRFQGTRSQETLQIQRPHIDLNRGRYGEAWIAPSKNGRDRWLPLHPLVREAIEPLMSEERQRVFTRDNKIIDPLFLTDKGLPYTDTRKGMGSNPFRRAHVGACKRASVTDFRAHDWRHHWATWNLKNGMDMRTLQVLGGWLDLNMVQKYAAVDMDHAGDQLARQK